MAHVFISYSRKDSDFVARLERALAPFSIPLWRDIHSIPGGAQWYQRIQQGLKSSYAMLYIDTANADESVWVGKEFLFAMNLKLPIIPLRLDEKFLALRTIDLNPVLCDAARFDTAVRQIMAVLGNLPQTPIVPGETAPAPTQQPEAPDSQPPLVIDSKAVSDYLEWLLTGLKADLRDALYVKLAAVSEARPERPAAFAPLDLGGIDLDLSFRMMPLERVRGEQFDQAGEPVADARQPLQAMDRVVLLGEPGTGKTTTLVQLAIDLARAARENPATARLPVFIPLRSYTGAQPFEDFIQSQLYTLQSAYPALKTGKRLLLLLDALNEMPRTGPDGEDLTTAVRDSLRDHDHWIVSCRVRDYQEELNELGEVGKLRLKPLDPPRIYDTIRQRYSSEWYRLNRIHATPADGEALWADIAGGPDLLKAWDLLAAAGQTETFWKGDWPRGLKAEGVQYVWDNPGYRDWQRMHGDRRRMLALCQNPYMTRLVADLYALDKSLPANRGALFKKFVDKLLERDRMAANAIGAKWIEDALIRKGLAQIAYQMGGETELPRPAVLESLAAHLPGTDAELLLWLAAGASLLEVGSEVRFTHQLLQEYFASEVLGSVMDTQPAATLWPLENWWQPNGREETAIILAGVRGDPQGVARWLAPAQPWFALEVLQHPDFELDVQAIDSETRETLIREAKAKTNEVSPVGRAAAYRVLGTLNADERPHIGLAADGLPDVDWVTIPAGPFIYGDDDKTGYSPFAPPADRQELALSTYQMSRYPITYRQFQAFIDATDGWADDRWWEGLAASAEHRSTPGDQVFKYGNHPRERVSWYDAMAFCRWWSWRLGGSYDLAKVGEWAVRLPTEYEWEKAARGREGLIYPYGNEFDASKGNTSATGIGQTSAVGLFAAHPSPYGVEEMSGNVWEWCLSDRAKPQLRAEDEDLRTDAIRTLRGGSWGNDQLFARAAYRILGARPGDRGNDLGFRVASAVGSGVPPSP